jgi:hypothetical protein
LLALGFYKLEEWGVWSQANPKKEVRERRGFEREGEICFCGPEDQQDGSN